MLKTSLLKKILLGFAVVLVLIQLIPLNRENPPVLSEPNWDSPRTRELAKRACFDCHSNEVKWSPMSYVAPMSWIVMDHIKEGRRELNFSEWTPQNPGEAEESAEALQSGEMPLWEYELFHPEAQLTPEEKTALIQGFQRTFGGGEREGLKNEYGERPEGEHEEGH